VKYSITAHKITAILSFLVLSSVQFFLLYNTYELTDDHYYLDEMKDIINKEYYQAIRNDKVMPGGQQILDHFIGSNVKGLEELYLHDRRQFDIISQKICDSAFQELKKANNIDSLLNAIIKRHRLYTEKACLDSLWVDSMSTKLC